MRTIWKFRIALDDAVQPVEMPVNAIILPLLQIVGLTHAEFWAEIPDTSATREQRSFAIHGTGHPVRGFGSWRASVIAPPFVWHLFEG